MLIGTSYGGHGGAGGPMDPDAALGCMGMASSGSSGDGSSKGKGGGKGKGKVDGSGFFLPSFGKNEGENPKPKKPRKPCPEYNL